MALGLPTSSVHSSSNRSQGSNNTPRNVCIGLALVTMLIVGATVMGGRSPTEFKIRTPIATGGASSSSLSANTRGGVACPTCPVCKVDCSKASSNAERLTRESGAASCQLQVDKIKRDMERVVKAATDEADKWRAEAQAAKAKLAAASQAPKKKALAKRDFVYNDCTEGGQSGCLTKQQRQLSNGQKGIVLWMTGLSGSGKSTIGKALEKALVLDHKATVYRLDGDNMRQGLNRDLGFAKEDRQENIRRAGEVAALFADSGVITIVSLISPYREQRDAARETAKQMGATFHEVFVDAPISVVQKRDPKGLYKKVAEGKIKSFTGLSKDAPYEAPAKPEVHIHTDVMTKENCEPGKLYCQAGLDAEVKQLVTHLKRAGVLSGAPAAEIEGGLSAPDGSKSVDLVATAFPTTPSSKWEHEDIPPTDYAPLPFADASSQADSDMNALRKEAAELPQLLLTDIDVNWLQVISEGWAAPMRGFMREGALLQTLHFNSLLSDPYNLTGSGGMNERKTDFDDYSSTAQAFDRVSSPWPVVLPTTSMGADAVKRALKLGNGGRVALVAQRTGQVLAVLNKPELYAWRQEEFLARAFGVNDRAHPWVKQWCLPGYKHLVGGELQMLGRIRFHDGLDRFRLTPSELRKEFEKRGADVVLAFQTRNPTHAGHLYLMNEGLRRLKRRGFKKPVLWLSPLGGWSKSSDVPLDVRLKQHDEVLKAGTAGGGLDPDNTVLGIWPSPMMYGGPTEVQWHAKSRRNAGANFFVVGRDPAGVGGSDAWVAAQKELYGITDADDLYDGNHGRYVLAMSPSMNGLGLMSFGKVYYDQVDHKMRPKDSKRSKDFLSISGTKMRKMAGLGREFCTTPRVPDDWKKTVSCVPQGFMPVKGWQVVSDYYKNKNNKDRTWIPYSHLSWPAKAAAPIAATGSKAVGRYGTKDFKNYYVKPDGQIGSWWHDVPLKASGAAEGTFNFIVEISKGTSAKMETTKEAENNPMMQDTKKGALRFYNYGVTFFNYGLFPQTWDDPNVKDETANTVGDNDPLDVIELGGPARPMGTILSSAKVIGNLRMLDSGETDDKVIVVDGANPAMQSINSISDLQQAKPGLVERLVDWLTNYKAVAKLTKVNAFASKEPESRDAAVKRVMQSHEHWKALTAEGSTVKHDAKFFLPKKAATAAAAV